MKSRTDQSITTAVTGYVRSIPKGATFVTTRSTVDKTVVSYWFNGQKVVKEFPPYSDPEPDLPDDL